jgi:predicted glycogen debranching enzyme
MSEYVIDTNGELQPHLQQEWLITNGLGSFASGTVVGCNTRRYHGILCAATAPPVGRIMLLNRMGLIIRIDGGDDHELSLNQFPSSFHPRGDRYLRTFTLGESARWDYVVPGAHVSQELTLVWQRNVAVVRLQVTAGKEARIVLRALPLVSIRDFHALIRKSGSKFSVNAKEEAVLVRGNEHACHIASDTGRFVEAPDWWFDHIYAVETERGQDDTEDLFVPGQFIVEKTGSFTVQFAISTEEVPQPNWDDVIRTRTQAMSRSPTPKPTPVRQRLCRAASDFIVARKAPDGSMGTTVIAGYPWFSDWGRDTMIALPGLLLTTGRHEEAGRVLSVFAGFVSEGMIPNNFNDYTNEPAYNTVDASLWFIHACFEYLRASDDVVTFNSRLLPACLAIVDGYRDGTRFRIAMDPFDSLITQGDPGTQLTWMDAKTGGVVFTPRHGKAVEINALWYNALRLLKLDELADRVQESFERAFWIDEMRGLCDVVNSDGRDLTVRPNQIFAVSLPHSPLSIQQQRAVVEVVQAELLTPYGLRTLSPADPRFEPVYRGNQFTRDRAYHNGTIWPWLIGAFLDAYLKVNNRSKESTAQARQWLTPLIEHMSTSGAIGQISEIFEAEPPHRPVGCFAQAWSVSEVLRLAVELEM